MGYKYTGDAIIGASLTVNAPKPLDSRSVVFKTEDLYSIPKETAYEGMLVANMSNGNTYMLIDKNKISEKSGWHASYESIQIITCTQQQYDAWLSNTDNFKPISDTGGFLVDGVGDGGYIREDVYYYIYEDSIDSEQFYVKYSDFQQWEETLKKKANESLVTAINDNLKEFKSNVETNYVTKDNLTESSQQILDEVSEQYYDKIESDDKYVSKSDITGESGDNLDYIFVTKTQHNSDLEQIDEKLSTTLKTEEDGSIKDLTVHKIESFEENLTIKTKQLYINESLVATESDIPQLVTLEQTEFDRLKENNQLNPDTFYYTYSDQQKDGIITNEILTNGYYSKGQVHKAIYNAIKPLMQRIAKLEGATGILDQGVLDEMKLG